MAGGSVTAQDTRNVVEPKIPAVCAVVKAQLSAKKGNLADEDEMKLDSERIQKAIDGCGSMQTVELAGSPGKSAFLSGPLVLTEWCVVAGGQGRHFVWVAGSEGV